MILSTQKSDNAMAGQHGCTVALEEGLCLLHLLANVRLLVWKEQHWKLVDELIDISWR